MTETKLTLLWAKLGQGNYSGRHPLICHLLDVGMVARQLWDKVLRDAGKKRIAAILGLEQEVAGRWLAFWAGAHDIGKAAPCFQYRPDTNRQNYRDARAALETAGFDFPRLGEKPHGTISTAALAQVLTGSEAWAGINRRFARRLAITVGGHHGIFPPPGSWDFEADILGGPIWHQARIEILNRLAYAMVLGNAMKPQAPPEEAHWFFMFLAGLTSVADWIGSNQQFFRPRPDVTDIAAYAREAADKASDALDELGWTGWEPDRIGPRTFSELFPFPPRGVQTAAVTIADRLNGPALVLIEAPMGEGKTEAALYLADRWTHACGQQGMYVALPTMATSNQMFDRVTKFLTHRYPTERVNAHLLHGMALLSEQYEQLRLDAIHDDDAKPGKVVAESWFAQNKKQALLAPFGVGTVDQVLLAALQTKHVFVRLFGLAGKTVILDEVHAYDTYMSTILERLLEWLAALGCSVVLLSATLPKAKRLALIEKWNPAQPPLDDSTEYPRVTVACGDQVEVQHVEPVAGRQPTLALEWHDPQKLADDLTAALSNGGCAAVVCNTVGRAQGVYQSLKPFFPGDANDGLPRLDLFHARYPFGERDKRENRAKTRFGPPDDPKVTRPDSAVLVATQVVEQSLDLDFDLMISDIAPVDLILQRSGRLHRHRRTRPKNLTTPTLWLMKPEQADGIPRFDNDEFIYERFVLLRSYLALRAKPTVRIPGDLERLIEAVYGDPDHLAAAPNERWEGVLAESRAEMERQRKEYQAAAKDVVIAPARFKDDILEVFNMDLDEDDPTKHRKLQAATRLTEPSVSVVLLHRTARGLSLWWDGDPVSLDRLPSLTDARVLLGNAVTLQHHGCVDHFVRQPTPEKWQESGLLRYHRIAELDESGCCPIGGRFILRLDANLGVVIERNTQSGGGEP